jgi:hypothetical protein
MNECNIVWESNETFGIAITRASRVFLHALGDIGIAVVIAKQYDVGRFLEILEALKDVGMTSAQQNDFGLFHVVGKFSKGLVRLANASDIRGIRRFIYPNHVYGSNPSSCSHASQFHFEDC